MSLVDLSAEDRKDFEKRLARLDLNEDALISEPLEIEAGKTLQLEMAGNSAVRPLILQTEDISVLRRWIGTPERAAEKRQIAPFEAVLRNAAIRAIALDETYLRGPAQSVTGRRTRSAKAPGRASRAGLADLTGVSSDQLLASVRKACNGPDRSRRNVRLASAEVDTIRAAARTLIHGDASTVAEYKPAVELYFEFFLVAVWLWPTIVVKKNATLQFGTGVHNLTAYELIIEQGGRVVSYGHLNVSVTKVRHSTLGWLQVANHVLEAPLSRRVF